MENRCNSGHRSKEPRSQVTTYRFVVWGKMSSFEHKNSVIGLLREIVLVTLHEMNQRGKTDQLIWIFTTDEKIVV